MWPGLGLDAQTLQNRPTPQTYPRAFTPNCKVHWDRAVASLPDAGRPADLWAQCLRTFVQLCRQANTVPTLGVEQARNDQIMSVLRTSRRAVLKVLDNAQVFRMMTLRTVSKTCRLTPSGFVIRVEGEIQALDPTATSWLLLKPWPAFDLKSRGLYRKQLDAHTKMVFYNAGANLSLRWFIGYEIEVSVLPALPRLDASKAELEAFVLNVLWRRVMTEGRTREWHRRAI